MSTTLTLLGTGTPACDADRYQTAATVVVGKHRLLSIVVAVPYNESHLLMRQARTPLR